MKLIWKLLRRHISVGQLAGFFIANLVGVVIILCGIQIYLDIEPTLSGKDGLIGNDYIIVSKPIKQLGSLMGKNTAQFSEEEIADIAAQPFAESVGAFKASQYGVYARLNTGSKSVSTDMFFESVPDRYIDVDVEQWAFDPESQTIPIIVPRNYLNLYNFGFAQAQGLPQLSEGILESISFDITLYGNYRREQFKGRVAGFSNRLNTILVPMSFMEWANDRYATGQADITSRLIVEVANPADESINAYLQQKGYDVENNSSDNSKIGFLLKLIVSIIVAIGAIISILAIYILTLSIYLLLQKNTEKLENLVLLGYTPRRVAAPYIILTASLNVVILAISIVIVYVVRGVYTARIATALADIADGGIAFTAVAGIIITAAIIAFNSFVIQRKINVISRKK
ncbi:MAG: ABC transporter permease [Alistipes sp.]|nr:ABC transporter permease [Alistipes sp.]